MPDERDAQTLDEELLHISQEMSQSILTGWNDNGLTFAAIATQEESLHQKLDHACINQAPAGRVQN